MGVLADWQLERERLRVGEKVLGSKDGNGDWHHIEGVEEDDAGEHRLEPCRAARSLEPGVQRNRSRCEQHGIDGRKIVVLAVLQKDQDVADEVSPSQGPIGPERMPEQ